jgi:hypothetical protein
MQFLIFAQYMAAAAFFTVVGTASDRTAGKESG